MVHYSKVKTAKKRLKDGVEILEERYLILDNENEDEDDDLKQEKKEEEKEEEEDYLPEHLKD